MPGQSTVALFTPGFPGMIADATFLKDVASYVSSETTNQIPWGVMLMQGTTDAGALLPTVGNVNRLIGICTYSAATQVNTEMGSVADVAGRIGILPGIQFGVSRRGRLWVQVEEAVTTASPVRIRNTVAGNGTGTFRTTSAGVGLSMLLVGCRYLDTAVANGICRVEFDMLLRNQFTAD